jgi:uncharacterized protein YukE
MDSMSHQPVAGEIGAQLVEIGTRALDSAAAAVVSLTSLMPAGVEEVSAQAATAFAAEAAAMLALNTAAQEELMRAGAALTDIARMYAQVDGEAAGVLTLSGAAMSRHLAASVSGASVGQALLPAEMLPGAAGSAARTSLLAGLIEAPSSPMAQAAGNLANVGSSMASGAAPLSSMGQGAAAGGSSQAGLAAAKTADRDEDDERRAGQDDQQPGERVL